MKTVNLPALILAALLSLGAFPAIAQNIAIVNGKAIPKTRLDSLIAQTAKSGRTIPEAQIRDELITREIFVQAAQKQGLDATPEYKEQMELARQSLLIRALLMDAEKKNQVSDAEIKAEYDRQAENKEFRARHILVDSQAAAEAIITSLKKGAKFEAIAKKQSKDTGSGANGGDLGWADPNSYVPEFSKALMQLSKGQITEKPVKSEFGYHVIRLEDSRAVQLPPLNDVKSQISEQLKMKKLNLFQENLRKNAKIE